MTIYLDGDSLEAELRALLARRALAEAQRAAAAGKEPRFSLRAVSARPLRLPGGIECIAVEAGPDAADNRIVELALPGDLAVTRDIPLAERLVKKGIVVINDRGDVFSAENVAERRSLRDDAAQLRSLGLAPESPRGRSWGEKEKKRFADALDREMSKLLAARHA